MGKEMHPEFRRIPFIMRLEYGFYQFFDHFLGRNFFHRLTLPMRRQFYKRLIRRLKKGGEGKMIPLERRTDLSYEEFMRDYVRKGRPVILEGAARDWKGVQEWSLDYFKELHGDDEVIFIDQNVMHRGEVIKTTLGEVIDSNRAGKGQYYRFYPLLKRHPEHILDFDYKWLRKRRLKQGFGEAFQVFLSGKGGFTPLHNASTQNLFTQMHGEKQWVLYPSHYTCIIDPDPARNVYRNSSKRNGKLFNPFSGETEAHWLYNYMDGYTVHLKAGDVFYNPPYMWHAVYNPTESIGVGYRYFTPLKAYAHSPLYMFLELFTFRPPIWKSWRNYNDINIIHLAEQGKLKEGARLKGDGSTILKSTV
jgi:hypothetical protein